MPEGERYTQPPHEYACFSMNSKNCGPSFLRDGITPPRSGQLAGFEVHMVVNPICCSGTTHKAPPPGPCGGERWWSFPAALRRHQPLVSFLPTWKDSVTQEASKGLWERPSHLHNHLSDPCQCTPQRSPWVGQAPSATDPGGSFIGLSFRNPAEVPGLKPREIFMLNGEIPVPAEKRF